MMKPSLFRDTRGATVIETAFALPAFIVMVWMMVQLGLVYRANSGIQHSLGQGARYATLYPTPTDDEITARMAEAVYGIGPGTFDTTVTDVPASGYKDLTVTYTQPTDLLLFPGPTINLTKSKRVWVASGATAPSGDSEGETSEPDPTDETDPVTEPDPVEEPDPVDEPGPVTPPPTTTAPGNSGDAPGQVVCKKRSGKAC
jgi:Flp pilus assembly protein TadG